MIWSKDAAEFCSAPKLLVAMPGNATGDFLGMVMKVVVEDLQDLGKMSADGELQLADGTLLTWRLMLDKDDSPMLAHKGGKSSAGSAHKKCARCSSHAFTYRDTVECLDFEPTTLESTDALARKIMAVEGFGSGIDLRRARVGQLRNLLHALNIKVGRKAKREELFQLASEAAMGVVSQPRVLGGLPYGTVEQMKSLMLLYDYSLHGVKGIGAEIRAAVKKGLDTGSKLTFDPIEAGVMGNKACDCSSRRSSSSSRVSCEGFGLGSAARG
jgi:hypothetical protein